MTVRLVAVLAALAVLAGCGSAPKPKPSPSPTGPSPALVSWSNAYCGATKDLRFLVYTLPKGFDIKSEADRPKAAAALQTLDTKLTATVAALRKLPKAPAPRANTLAAGELSFYAGLLAKVTEYRTLLPRAPLSYAQSALTLTELDLSQHTPAVETDSVPGLRAAMDASPNCRLS
ncbi:hypothetical protein [Fodinicola acaciae]|uniref:hypothetical protein n=1 Tax=Fodinicola acaciae TaxID=2681555 RepID=UPI0013D86790|nr:hypothetical protein [Fodinicola acaciae]